jgi:hypothetical protein
VTSAGRPQLPRRAREARSSQRELEPRIAPGRRSLLLAAVMIGVLLLAIQLWLLTIALDLFLGGRGAEIWSLAIISGLIFAGGLAAYRVLRSNAPPRG